MIDKPVRIRKAKEPQELTLGQLFHAVNTIQASGEAKEFLENHKDHTVTVHHDLINSAKAFLQAKEAHLGKTVLSESARQILVSPGGRCPDPSDSA